ncbi:hypothetical protein MPL3365_250111 [Mesorhizobium plurifarium]|uniref:Uncharacterized protein n=1 Tax=Mesorhizobium plurifarium TaxID=69974 RepID=A0A090G5A3_MESPL|nr:hypothetical protein MPL3365_250111 [Mesorhizobium plurifarium]
MTGAPARERSPLFSSAQRASRRRVSSLRPDQFEKRRLMVKFWTLVLTEIHMFNTGQATEQHAIWEEYTVWRPMFR